MAKATLLLLGIYVFFHTTFTGEILANYLGIYFPIVAVTGAIVAVSALFTRSVLQFLRTPLALPWILLFVWMVLASVLSYWARASLQFVIAYGLRFELMPFLFCALALSSKEVRNLLSVAASGLIVILFLCAARGEIIDGRFGIPATDLVNPNDLAFHLLWSSMLAMVFLLNSGALRKLLSLAILPLAFWYSLKTGSRANFLTFIVLFVAVFIVAPRGTKILMALGGPLAIGLVLMALPKSDLNRMLAIDFTASEQDVAARVDETQDLELRGAVGSQAARMELQKLAISATLRHPFLGVGPLMFENETADYILTNIGEKAPWQTAHNSYLKISSENGIVGLIFYIWVILAAFRLTYRTYLKTRGNPDMKIAYANSVGILLALVVYAFGSLFSDIVYLSYLSITLGFAGANYLAVLRDERKAGASADAPRPIAAG